VRQPLPIESYGNGGFRVAGVWRPGSLLILNDVAHDWPPASLAGVTVADLADVLAAPTGQVEFVLLGTGPAQALPSRELRDALRAAGLGLEFMATEAAARTHNVLAQQGRLFATALIAI
jgi:uncharacterized protein